MPLKSLLRAFVSRPARKAPNALRVAVIGAGRMGGFHAHRISRMAQANLVAVVDADRTRAATLAKKYKAQALTDISALAGLVQAVIVATPTDSHFAVGRSLLEAGIACLIEKPLAATLPEAEELIRIADARHVVLQVGHVERFNPAVVEAARFINQPKFIEVNRLGPYDPRVAGVGVVMDLMIHDLDIILFLMGEAVTRVEAFGARVLSEHEDIAKVRLHFSGGCIADLSASRVSLKKYRRIRIFQQDSYLSLDYAAPNVTIYKKKAAVVKSLLDINVIRPTLSKEDPLSLELAHFFDCVVSGKAPAVSGKHGRDALELAREILQQLKIHG